MRVVCIEDRIRSSFPPDEIDVLCLEGLDHALAASHSDEIDHLVPRLFESELQDASQDHLRTPGFRPDRDGPLPGRLLQVHLPHGRRSLRSAQAIAPPVSAGVEREIRPIGDVSHLVVRKRVPCNHRRRRRAQSQARIDPQASEALQDGLGALDKLEADRVSFDRVPLESNPWTRTQEQ